MFSFCVSKRSWYRGQRVRLIGQDKRMLVTSILGLRDEGSRQNWVIYVRQSKLVQWCLRSSKWKQGLRWLCFIWRGHPTEKGWENNSTVKHIVQKKSLCLHSFKFYTLLEIFRSRDGFSTYTLVDLGSGGVGWVPTVQLNNRNGTVIPRYLLTPFFVLITTRMVTRFVRHTHLGRLGVLLVYSSYE